MPRWWRNARRVPAAGPAAQTPARPRDDWRTLPPLSPVTPPPAATVATDSFSDSLSTWQDPRFLAPLGHHIDRDGPAGLVTGLAAAAASPQPQTYQPDVPLPPDDGGDAQVQRSVTSWPGPPPTRSWLVSAPEVEHDPVPLLAVPAGAADTGHEPASTQTTSARDQEAGPPAASADPGGTPAATPAEPIASPGSPAAGADEAGTTAPTLHGGQLETSITPGHPHSASREMTGVAVQRQSSAAPPQPSARRLGLGAPLNYPDGGPPARAVPVPPHQPAARYGGPAAPADPGRQVQRKSAPAGRGSEAGAGPAAVPSERPPGPGAGWPAGPAGAAEPIRGEAESPAGPGPAATAGQVAAAPPAGTAPDEPLPAGAPLHGRLPAGAPLAEAPLVGGPPDGTPPAGAAGAGPALPEVPLPAAPLLGELPLVMRSAGAPPAGAAPSAAQRVTPMPGASPPAAAQRMTPVPGESAPAAGPPSPPAPAHIQRLAGPPAVPGGHARMSPAGMSPAGMNTAAAPWQPAGPRPGPGVPPPDVRQAGPPGGKPAVQRIAQPAPPATTGTLPPARHAVVAPLLGHRQPLREPEPVFLAQPGPVPAQAAVVSAAPGRAGTGPGPAPGAVQRSAVGYPAASGAAGRAPGLAVAPAAAPGRELTPGLADPGAIAVAGGIAHRDPDGSVVFDLRPSLVLPDQAVSAADGQPDAASRTPAAVQRQEAAGPADSSEAAADAAPSPAPMVQPATPATPAAPAAPGPASPPLDELARQLFGPLAARLKAELWLDRERAGLLTDLRR